MGREEFIDGAHPSTHSHCFAPDINILNGCYMEFNRRIEAPGCLAVNLDFQRAKKEEIRRRYPFSIAGYGKLEF